MKIAELSVKNSLLVNLISVFIIIVGTFSMLQMQREAFPQVDYDIVTVTTVWPGAPTEDVEKFVTIPLEEELQSVSGLQEVDSRTDEGLSSIGVTIEPSVTDKRKVVNDIQRAVDRVRNLPEEAEDPEVFELATSEFPIIEVSISGAVTEKVRREYAESLKDELLDIEGVSQVREIGWRDYEFWVEVDPKKLTDYHVSLQEIMEALRTRNVTVPGGQLTTADKEFNVRTTGEFKTAKEIGEVIIRANDSGNWLKVKDVAEVKESFEDATTIAKVNGESASAMVVVKTEQADAIKVVDKVKEVIEEFRTQLPAQMEIKTANDFSFYVKRRLGVLTNNGIIGFILVLFILFLFLDPIPAFMTAFGIPIALCTSFLIMGLLGITINLVSMLGIILVLGMLVDDGIIVAENVYRHVENGLSPREAAIKGTNEVALPVTITILTTFAAFGPLMFMDDVLGKFIREIPKVVLITLSASLFEAFVILPSHLSDAVGLFNFKHKKKKAKGWYTSLIRVYRNSLDAALRGRYLVILAMIVVFGFTMWVAKTQMKFILFAGDGIEYFWVRAEASKGTPLERMNELLAPVEKAITELSEEELESYRTYIGSIESESGFDPNAKRGTHLAQITVFLTPSQQRDRRPREIMDDIRTKLEKLEGFEKLTTLLPKEGPPTGADVEVGIKGEEYSVMEGMTVPFIAYLEGTVRQDSFEDIFVTPENEGFLGKIIAKLRKGQPSSENSVEVKSAQLYQKLRSLTILDENSKLVKEVDNYFLQFTDFLKALISKEARLKIKNLLNFREEFSELSRSEFRQMLDIFGTYRKHSKGVSDISTSYDYGKKQLKVVVDEEKAKKYFLNIGQIATTVRNVFKGGVATTIKPEKADEEINVVVRFPEAERNRLDIFDDIQVPNAKGNLIKLSAVAEIEESEGVYLINHYDGKRVLYVTAQVDNKNVTSLEVNRKLQKEFAGMADDKLGYAVQYGGEFEDQQKSAKNLMRSYLFALFLIFILLVGMFKSLIQPFIVMIAIPFGVIGVILAFWVHDMILPGGRPLNFFALMGLVGLTGIVVNDSVVLMDFINRHRREGGGRRQSLLEAGVIRLRPVIMTSITTIGGLVSVAYGIGGGDPFLKPMALAIVWGLTFSTLLTLIGIPCLYAVVDDFANKFLHHSIVKDAD